MRPKLVIFDFDGTLADTTETIIATYQAAIGELGVEARTDNECRATIGLPLKEGFRQLYPRLSDAELDECVAVYRRIFVENKSRFAPRLYPGVKETLSALAGERIAMSIASSRSHWSLKEFCDDNGITEYFSVILGADDVVRAKPDPEPVLKTMELLSENSDDTVVVGDMPVDIAMGSGAGCRTVGVAYGNSSEAELIAAGATAVIDRFPDLIAAIRVM